MNRIAFKYFGWTASMFLLGAILAIFMKIEACYGDVSNQAVLNQMLTYHGIVMAFLFVIPVIPTFFGFAVMPKQLKIAETCCNGVPGFTTYSIGSLLVIASALKFAVSTGWAFTPPYSLIDGGSLAIMAIGLVLVALSWAMTGMNFIRTVHKSELSFFDLPMLPTAIYLNSFLMIIGGLSFSVIVVPLSLANAFAIGPFAGQFSTLLWENSFWFAVTPLLFFALIPAVGLMSDVISGLTKRELVSKKSVSWSLIALSILSLSSWGTHIDQGHMLGFVFSAISLLSTIPIALIVYSWVATFSRGPVACQPATRFTVAFLVSSGIGILSTLFTNNMSIGSYLSLTMFTTAQIHYLMVGGIVTPVLAGLHFWWTDITGKEINFSLGKLSGFLYMIGINAAFFPQIIMGTKGLPQGMHTIPVGFELLNVISSFGMILLIGALLLVAYNLVTSTETVASE
jgi:cytochrome c oxidase subunit I